MRDEGSSISIQDLKWFMPIQICKDVLKINIEALHEDYQKRGRNAISKITSDKSIVVSLLEVCPTLNSRPTWSGCSSSSRVVYQIIFLKSLNVDLRHFLTYLNGHDEPAS
ncbi:hypothetical protein RHSIM_RhsimUnG0000700 [Rhododendron simsii]|uniref:Uncharacterized protein n=1 Tax=Rhododendron simsii TaxID=118357 RepID=A0A834L663_RHOSS|nr:hypothetical protein RHSIM_RhsimUnG0000700 [Rhododendron simsii]